MTKSYKVNGSQDGMIIHGIKTVSASGNSIMLRGNLTVIFTRNGKTLRRLARTVWGVRSDLTTEIN